jgi:hypothetical protein
MGRPTTRPKDLKDGFYIEIRNKGAKTGIKIRRDNNEQMVAAIESYERIKDIIILGEFKGGKFINPAKPHTS